MTTIDFTKRPIVDISALCEPIPTFPKKLCITLPGGVEVCSQPSLLQLGLLNYARAGVDMASAVLAPLTPLFKVMDVVVSIKNVLSTIPDVIGPPPNLKPFLEALTKLTERVVALVRIMPAFSVPIMALNLLDMIILNLEGFVAELRSLQRFKEQIARAQIGAADAFGLQAIVKCSEAQYDAQMSNLEHMFGTLNALFDLIDLFASLAGLGDPFPIAEAIASKSNGKFSGSASDAADALEHIADFLHTVREAIPI